MDGTEQPTAPYLEAIGAYAFRGPGRYHVPGHKGGPGADPGLHGASDPAFQTIHVLAQEASP